VVPLHAVAVHGVALVHATDCSDVIRPPRARRGRPSRSSESTPTLGVDAVIG
jgi:hypothetical protein